MSHLVRVLDGDISWWVVGWMDVVQGLGGVIDRVRVMVWYLTNTIEIDMSNPRTLPLE